MGIWGGNDDEDVGATADGEDGNGIGDPNVFHLDGPDISTSSVSVLEEDHGFDTRLLCSRWT